MKNILTRGLFVIISIILVTPPSFALTCTSLVKPLSKGSKNGEVLKLQQFLFESGFLVVKPNGYFGNGTMSAVKKFQKENGLSQVGSVGTLTRGKVQEISCSPRNSFNTATTNNNDAPIVTSGVVESSNLSISGTAPYKNSSQALVLPQKATLLIVLNKKVIYEASSIPVIDGRWSYKISKALPEGEYGVIVQSALDMGDIWATSTINIKASAVLSGNTSGAQLNSEGSKIVNLDVNTFQGAYPVISGTASGLSAISISIKEKSGNKYTKYGNSHIDVIDGKWKIKLSTPLVGGLYDIEFFTDKYEKRLTSSIISIKQVDGVSVLPSCSVSTDKKNYNYGDEIKISWTTKDAEFMMFYFEKIASDSRFVQSRIPLQNKNETGFEIVKLNQYSHLFSNLTNKEIVEPLKIRVTNFSGDFFCTTSLNISK